MNSFEAFEKMVGEALDKAYRDAALFGMGLVAIPAAPQPSAPAVACKAPKWCGFKADSETCERRAAWLSISPRPKFIGGWTAGTSAFSSQECCDRRQRKAPLAAQPAEAKRCCDRGTLGCDAGYRDDGRLHSHRQFCKEQQRKPAEQPKPAKGHDFSDPYCARRYKGAVVRLCVDCGTFETTPARECGTGGPMWRVDFERWVGKESSGILRDPAITERLPRPRLAHSMGIEDPTLPEAR